MRRLHCLIAVLLLLSAAARDAAADQGGHGYALQLPGSFHGEEVVAADGEAWLALVRDAHGAHLEAVHLSVEPMHDEMVDAEGEASGRTVAAEGVEAIAFLRGPDLLDGDVHAVLPQDVQLVPGLALWLDDARTQSITLACTTFAPPPSDGTCGVTVSSGIGTATLIELPAILTSEGSLLIGDDGHVRLLFAGDLNGDHAPDLLIDASEHYNLTQVLLFMSRPDGHYAAPVKVAGYHSVGC